MRLVTQLQRMTEKADREKKNKELKRDVSKVVGVLRRVARRGHNTFAFHQNTNEIPRDQHAPFGLFCNDEEGLRLVDTLRKHDLDVCRERHYLRDDNTYSMVSIYW